MNLWEKKNCILSFRRAIIHNFNNIIAKPTSFLFFPSRSLCNGIKFLKRLLNRHLSSKDSYLSENKCTYSICCSIVANIKGAFATLYNDYVFVAFRISLQNTFLWMTLQFLWMPTRAIEIGICRLEYVVSVPRW